VPLAAGKACTQTIGLLCDAFGDAYSLSVLHGAVDHLTRAGLHALSFCGGYPRAPLFHLRDGVVGIPAVIDGLIVLSATLRSPEVELGKLALSVTGPVVSVGDHVPGIANVGVNDEAAVFQSVAHLVKRHECKRIAYIAGPEGSVDGERRLAAYRLALEHFDLQRDATLVARGNFEASSGREAALRLRASAGRFDAIVAANDLMAIGAAEALHSAGVSVPETVKVVGFDGIDESPFACGGLTTVRQPVVEQGAAAADLIRRMLAGEAVELSPTLISAALLIRHTCGCGSNAEKWRAPAAAPAASPVAGEELALLDDAFRETIRKQLATKRLKRELARMAAVLLGARDYEELAGVMTGIVRLFEMPRFLLCTYASDPRLARIVLESRGGRDVTFRPQAEALPVGQLLGIVLSKCERPTSLFVEPLEIADEHFGFFIIEGDLSYGVVQLELRYLLAGALSRIAMMGEIRRIYLAQRQRERFAQDATPARDSTCGSEADDMAPDRASLTSTGQQGSDASKL
jgi:DNA-binding LacI/PurR family transcriptional regulator